MGQEGLNKTYGIRGIPSLVLVDGTTGDLITKNGRSAIMDTDFDALRTYEADKAAAAAELNKKMVGAPNAHTHASHPHPLKKMESVYSGMYGCDLCQGSGEGWVYHCDECGWDAHPKCVGI